MALSRSQPVHDPRVLRALAHPVRGRILDEMHAAGSLRAADVAAALDIPANQASFHLRQLARYGLVEPDAEAGRDRRDRVWRPVAQDGLRIDVRDLENAPGGKAAFAVWRRGSSAWAQHVIAEAYASLPDEEAVRSISETPMRLTEAEARQLLNELDDVLRRWSGPARVRTEGARTYLFLSTLGPYPEDRDSRAAPVPGGDEGRGGAGEVSPRRVPGRVRPGGPGGTRSAPRSAT